jgi:hypothetical protein
LRTDPQPGGFCHAAEQRQAVRRRPQMAQHEAGQKVLRASLVQSPAKKKKHTSLGLECHLESLVTPGVVVSVHNFCSVLYRLIRVVRVVPTHCAVYTRLYPHQSALRLFKVL